MVGLVGAGAEAAVASRPCPAGTTDWDTYAKAALAGEPGRRLLGRLGGAAAARLLAALRAAGYDGKFVAVGGSPRARSSCRRPGDAAEGAFVIAPASPQNLPEAAAWAKRFEARFKHAPGFDALQAYDGVRALAQAVTQSGKVDRARNSQRARACSTESYKTLARRRGPRVRPRPHDQVTTTTSR